MLKGIYSFLIVYAFGIAILILYKELNNYPDYVIPGLAKLIRAFKVLIIDYFQETAKTFLLAALGHLTAIVSAFVLAILVATQKKVGSFVQSFAYNLQAYPLVAIAPLLFILFGDEFFTQLFITSLICYFPILLSVLGILRKPVEEVEHFFKSTAKLSHTFKIKIRILENLKPLSTTITGSASLAVVGAILTEYLAEFSGIGYQIWLDRNGNNLSGILVALFTIGLLNSIYINFIELTLRKVLSRIA